MLEVCPKSDLDFLLARKEGGANRCDTMYMWGELSYQVLGISSL